MSPINILKCITNPLNMIVVVVMFITMFYSSYESFVFSLSVSGAYWFFSSLIMIMHEKSSIDSAY